MRESPGEESEEIHIPKIMKEIESHKEPEEKDKLKIIKWCWIRHLELPYVLVLFSMLMKGKSELGFCECAACDQGYREFLAFTNSLPGKRKLKASSRNIVKKAQEQDITKFSIDVFNLINDTIPKETKNISQGLVAQTIQNCRENEGKILLELDETMIERVIIKVLSSDQGQNIIKNAYAPKKKRGRNPSK